MSSSSGLSAAQSPSLCEAGCLIRVSHNGFRRGHGFYSISAEICNQQSSLAQDLYPITRRVAPRASSTLNCRIVLVSCLCPERPPRGVPFAPRAGLTLAHLGMRPEKVSGFGRLNNRQMDGDAPSLKLCKRVIPRGAARVSASAMEHQLIIQSTTRVVEFTASSRRSVSQYPVGVPTCACSSSASLDVGPSDPPSAAVTMSRPGCKVNLARERNYRRRSDRQYKDGD